MDIEQFEGRKRDHIRHALDQAHQTRELGGLDKIHLVHEALPELAFDEVRCEATMLGQATATPFYVAGMTAGHSDAERINSIIASACHKRGWTMGLGSQRRELESGNHGDEWRRLLEMAPGLRLLANIGLSQLIKAPTDKIRRLVDGICAKGLVVHANSLQECLQPEGTPDFRGAKQRLREVCAEIGVPVILKETGCGFSLRTLRGITETGLAAIDVSGLGGTHWGRIEGARAFEQNPDDIRALGAGAFANWGETTVSSVLAAKNIQIEIWASGGVRSGLDAAKLIALGAQAVGYAKPALEAAMLGQKTLESWMEQQEFELRVALFCTGSKNPYELRNKEGVWTRNDENL